jgi:hypothetical protein
MSRAASVRSLRALGPRAAKRVLEPGHERVAGGAEAADVHLRRAEQRLGIARVHGERAREGEARLVEPAERGERARAQGQRSGEPWREPERLLRAGDRTLLRAGRERIPPLFGEHAG